MMALYVLTLFTSALLLFLVQPMVGKMILPGLGGTPAVWTTCMVFFQAMLLAGYAYAHGAAARLSTRRQILLHLCVLLLPVAVLPICVARAAAPPSTDSPTAWLLLQLLLGIGLPFFVVSSSAPLLQNWFARTGHRDARDPYFLYAASNTGSLLALLGYPLLVEPRLSLADQSQAWTWGYGLLALLIAACSAALWRSPVRDRTLLSPLEPGSPSRTEISLRTRFTWVLLSAIPSSLMLGVTTCITTDLAAVPLMWVLPLALYLLTFVLVFARTRIIPHRLVVKLFPFLVLPMGILLFFRPDRMEWLIVLAHLGTFFVAAMLCHGELVERRPSSSRLTEFYLFMSVGGVLGGLFNAVVAPQVFTGIVEYPLVLALACLALPKAAAAPAAPDSDRAMTRRDVLGPALLAVLAAAVLGVLHAASWHRAAWAPPMVFIALSLGCFAFKARPVRFGLSYGVLLMTVAVLADLRTGNVLHAERNFFGVKRVVVDPEGRLRLLVHGTTSHGCQPLAADHARDPSSYYHRTGPIGDLFAVFNDGGEAGVRECRVGIIGLGVGAVAAYAQPGQHFTFFEIDPAVERIARDPRFFSYLADCRGTCDVVLGDGRLTVAAMPDGHFDLLVLDAFSSDSVPTHLLSREAVALYLSKLSDEGMLGFHVSNRFFDFETLLARAAADMGLVCLARFDHQVSPTQAANGKLASHWVVMGRRGARLDGLAHRPGWRVPESRFGMRAWTDQYCDVVGLFLEGKRLNLGPRSALAR